MGLPTKVALFNDTSSSGHFGCDAVIKTIEDSVTQRGGKIVYRHPVGRGWEEDADALAAIETADVVLVNGEGSIHHSSERAASLAGIGPYCRKHGIPGFLVNCTVQSNSERIMRDIGDFSGVWARESYSVKEMELFGIKASLCPDFSLYQSMPHWSPERKNPVFVDSVNKRDNQKVEAWAAKASGIFVTMKKGGGGCARYYPRRSFLRRFFSRVPTAGAGLCSIADFSSFGSFLASAPYVVTGRFHAFCFCLRAGVPVFVISSNTWKSEALLFDVGINRERLVTTAPSTASPGYSDQELRRINEYLATAEASIDDLFDVTMSVTQ